MGEVAEAPVVAAAGVIRSRFCGDWGVIVLERYVVD